jgi:hypothetical protein
MRWRARAGHLGDVAGRSTTGGLQLLRPKAANGPTRPALLGLVPGFGNSGVRLPTHLPEAPTPEALAQHCMRKEKDPPTGQQLAQLAQFAEELAAWHADQRQQQQQQLTSWRHQQQPEQQQQPNHALAPPQAQSLTHQPAADPPQQPHTLQQLPQPALGAAVLKPAGGSGATLSLGQGPPAMVQLRLQPATTLQQGQYRVMGQGGYG